MTTPDAADDIRTLWRSLPTEPVTITVEEMRARVRKFERRIRRRNMIEYAACTAVVAIFLWYATFSEPTSPLWPAANILVALGAAFAGLNLYRRGRAARAPEASSVASLVDFHRAELLRQRDALTSLWAWYVLPFVPGMTLWFIAAWMARPPERSDLAAAIGLGAVIAIVVGMSVGVILLNLLGAAHLQRKIEDLARYTDMDQLSDLGRMGDFGKKRKT
jgi:hypothetical protein